MSKKSRRRNKKILAVLGALGGAALMAKNKRNASIEANEAKEAGFAKSTNDFEDQSYSTGPKKDTSKKTDYITKKDTKPKTVVNRSRNKVIYSDGTSDTPGTIYQKNKIKNEMPDTPPPSIDNPYSSRVIKGGRNFGNRALKNGGRAGLRSGGKAIKKSMGKALRGGGKVMR